MGRVDNDTFYGDVKPNPAPQAPETEPVVDDPVETEVQPVEPQE